ncbi:MAG: insulinase family protein [Acidobacteria bacterium]|nr:insulinase family protein [Acidobacteriota bacterium]
MKRHTIPVLRKALPNGLVLLIAPNSKIPLVHINGVIRCGTVDNPSQRPGLASLTTRMLDEGTSSYSHEEIATLIETLGGSLATFSNRELSGIGISVLSKDIAQGIDLAHAVLTDPVFPAARLSLEKEKVLNQIRSANDNPQIVASIRFNRIIYQHHPLGEPVLGTEEAVRTISAGELAEFHRQRFTPSSTLMIVVGDVQPQQCIDLLSEKFGKWRGDPPRAREVPVLGPLRERVVQEIPMAKEQINIYLGHLGVRRTDADYYALQVVDVILGGGPGFTSRIPAKLRDQQGLAYATYSDITSSAGLYPGRFAAFISTSPENRERALNGLIGEIRSLVDDGITETELANAQSYLTGNFVFDFQSNSHVARFVLSAEMFDLGFDYIDRYPLLIQAIRKSEVEEAARRLLDLEHYATVIVGPSG